MSNHCAVHLNQYNIEWQLYLKNEKGAVTGASSREYCAQSCWAVCLLWPFFPVSELPYNQFSHLRWHCLHCSLFRRCLLVMEATVPLYIPPSDRGVRRGEQTGASSIVARGPIHFVNTVPVLALLTWWIRCYDDGKHHPTRSCSCVTVINSTTCSVSPESFA